MKKMYIVGMLLLAGQMTFAQRSHNFKMERADQKKMVNPVNLVEREMLDEMAGVTFPIGFDFSFSKELVVDQLRFTADGSLEGIDVETGDAVFKLNPLMSVDLIDRGKVSGMSESSVTYSQQGSRGDRRLVVEWKNVGFQKELDAFNTGEDFMNFQLELSQAGNRITYTFGRSKIRHPELYFGLMGPQIGVDSEKMDSKLFLDGMGNRPVAVEANSGLEYLPPNNVRMVFFPRIVGDEIVQKRTAPSLNAKIYPNPFSDRFTITLAEGLPEAKVVVKSPYGKVVFEGRLTDNLMVDLAGFDQGLYVVYISSLRQTIARKVMKR